MQFAPNFCNLQALLANMIKYVLSTGICLLLCGIANTQHTSSSTDPVEIKTSAANSVIVALPSKNKSGYDLPSKGDITATMNEAVLYNGTVKNHHLHGRWQSWYNSNRLCDSGSFVKGIPHGEWKYWDSNGQLLAIRHYDANKLARIKEEISRGNPKSTLYPITVLYKKNSQHGEQYMKAGYSFGFTDHHTGKLSLQQAVTNNVIDSKRYRPVFDECLHHGLYMNFYSDGRVKDSGYYKNGLRDGIWLQRNSSGNSYLLGSYKNGVKQGEWKQYNESGRLMTFIFYNNRGEEQWRKKWNTDDND